MNRQVKSMPSTHVNVLILSEAEQSFSYLFFFNGPMNFINTDDTECVILLQPLPNSGLKFLSHFQGCVKYDTGLIHSLMH